MEDQNTILDEVLNVLSDTESLIQDNKLIFLFENKNYRARMPSQKERTWARQAKEKEYYRLCKEGILPFEKDLIKELNETKDNIINKLQKQLDDLNEQYIQNALSLSTKRDGEEKSIQLFKEKKALIEFQRRIVSSEKAEKLSPSIENQSLDVFYKMLTSFCIEILLDEKEDKWEKVWKNFEEFDNDNTKLPLIAAGRFVELFYQV